MKKDKCDICGKKEDIITSTMRVVGKSKLKMSAEELKNNNTHIGDNQTFEKKVCKECGGK